MEETETADGRERRWRPRVLSIDFAAGADADEEFQAASMLARAAMLDLSDGSVRDYLQHERSFSSAWREAAAFLHTTIVATPAELTELTHAIQNLLAEYAPSARKPPRGARTVTASVRAVPKP